MQSKTLRPEQREKRSSHGGCTTASRGLHAKLNRYAQKTHGKILIPTNFKTRYGVAAQAKIYGNLQTGHLKTIPEQVPTHYSYGSNLY